MKHRQSSRINALMLKKVLTFLRFLTLKGICTMEIDFDLVLLFFKGCILYNIQTYVHEKELR